MENKGNVGNEAAKLVSDEEVSDFEVETRSVMDTDWIQGTEDGLSSIEELTMAGEVGNGDIGTFNAGFIEEGDVDHSTANASLLQDKSDVVEDLQVDSGHELEGSDAAIVELLTYQDIASVVVCKECRFPMLNYNMLRTHVLEIHAMRVTKKVARMVYVEYVKACGGMWKGTETKADIPLCLGGSRELSETHKIYRAAPFGLGKGVVLNAVKGLLVENGYECPFCPGCFTDLNLFEKHVAVDHKDMPGNVKDISDVATREMWPVQRLGRRKTRGCPANYFRVKNLDQEMQNELLYGTEDVMADAEFENLGKGSQMRNIMDVSGQMGDRVGCLEMDMFDNTVERSVKKHKIVQLLRLDVALRDYGYMSLEDVPVDLVRPVPWKTQTDEDEVERIVRDHIREYLGKVVEVYRDGAPYITRVVKPTDSTGKYDRRYFTLVTREDSLRRYTDQVSRFVLAMARLGCRGEGRGQSSRDFSLGEDVLEPLRSYMDVMKVCNVENATSKKRRWGSDVCNDAPWAVRDVMLHTVLRSLLLVHLKDSGSVRGLAARYFMALMSVHPHVDLSKRYFKQAKDMSHSLAAMLYMASCVGIVEMRRRDVFPSGQEGAWSELRVQTAFDCNQNTAVGFIRHALDACMGVMRNETGDVRFFKCVRHYRCGLIDGHEVQLKDLGGAVVDWKESAERILREDVLMGMPIPDGFDKVMETASDDFTNATKGISMLSVSGLKDWCQSAGLSLPKHFDEDETARKALLDDPTNTDSGVSRDGLERWLSKVEDLKWFLLPLLHVMGGGTARATEMEIYQFENGPDSQRNIFVKQKELYIRSGHGKTDWLAGFHKPIVRVLDRYMSTVFLLYFTLVRPFENAVVSYLEGSEAAEVHARYLFAKKGRPYSADIIRSVVKDRLHKSGINLGFVQYRHYQTAMSRTFLSDAATRRLLGGESGVALGDVAGLQSAEEENPLDVMYVSTGGDLPIHAQSGHTSRTADRVYGLSTMKVDGLQFDDVSKMRSASLMWAKLLYRSMEVSKASSVVGSATEPGSAMRTMEGISGRGGLSGMCEGKATGEQIVKVNDGVPPPDAGASGTLGNPKRMKTIDCDAGGNAVAVDQEEKEGLSVVTHEIGRRDCAANSHKPISLVETNCFVSHLRTLTGEADWMFKSPSQLEATVGAVKGVNDYVVVLPTGGGKSLIFQLAAFIERPQAKVTIVIVPLVALIEDHVRRCRVLGLRVGTWTSREDLHVDIMLFSVERVGSADYETLVGRLNNQGRLARIVVDEAHLTMTWATFRDSMRHMGSLLCPGGDPVQRILLSATIPPDMEASISRAHGLVQYKVCREKTVRQNLKYQVHEVNTQFKSGREAMVVAARDLVLSETKKLEETTVRGQVVVYCHSHEMVRLVGEAIRKSMVWCAGDGDGGEDVRKEVLEYHAGMTAGDRLDAMKAWSVFNMGKGSAPRCQVMVATCAFGTGIDAPNVRLVVHVGFARSLLEYVQESGRAGRDGKTAKCIVLYNRDFLDKQKAWLKKSTPEIVKMLDQERLKDGSTWNPAHLNQGDEGVLGLSHFSGWAENKTLCRRQNLFRHMDKTLPEPCVFYSSDENGGSAWCDNCERIVGGRIDKAGVVEGNAEGSPSFNVMDVNPVSQKETVRQDLCGTLVADTTRLNSIFGSVASSDTIRMVEEFNVKCTTRLQPYCVLCLVQRGREHVDKKGQCIRGLCFACNATGHSVIHCPLFGKEAMAEWKEIKKEAVCWGCGMGRFQGRELHEKAQFGSRRTCPLISAVQVGLLLCFGDEHLRGRVLKGGAKGIEWPVLDPGALEASMRKAYVWLTMEAKQENMGTVEPLNVMKIVAKMQRTESEQLTMAERDANTSLGSQCLTATSSVVLVCGGVKMHFPKPPYRAQVVMMREIRNCIVRETNGCFESPTGSGKTMAVITATLATREAVASLYRRTLVQVAPGASDVERLGAGDIEEDDDFECINKVVNKKRRTSGGPSSDPNSSSACEDQLERELPDVTDGKIPFRIFVASRTNNQSSQSFQQVRASEYSSCVGSALASRKELCAHHEVAKSPHRDAQCREMVREGRCPYYHGADALSKNETFRREISDIESLGQFGKGLHSCAYHASRRLADDAEIVLTNYHYILDAGVRRACKLDISGDVVVFDEAHNVEKACRELRSIRVNHADLQTGACAVREMLDGWEQGGGVGLDWRARRRLSSLRFVFGHLLTMEGILRKLSGGVDARGAHRQAVPFVHIEEEADGAGLIEVKEGFETEEMCRRLKEVGLDENRLKLLTLIVEFVQNYNDGKRDEREQLNAIDTAFNNCTWGPALNMETDALRANVSSGGLDDSNCGRSSGSGSIVAVANCGESADHGGNVTSCPSAGEEATQTSSGEVTRQAETSGSSERVTGTGIRVVGKRRRVNRGRCRQLRIGEDSRGARVSTHPVMGSEVRTEGVSGTNTWKAGVEKFVDTVGKLAQVFSAALKENKDFVLAVTKDKCVAVDCLNPAVVFREVEASARCVILMSGTLGPLDRLGAELGVSFPIQKTLPHAFNVDEQVVARVCSNGVDGEVIRATYNLAKKPAFRKSLLLVLAKLLLNMPGGALVFFTSYRVLKEFTEVWQNEDAFMDLMEKKSYLGSEPRENGEVLQTCLRKFREGAETEKGAVLFGVVRGKIFEGVDFSNHYCRGVFIVGVPFLNRQDPIVNSKMKWNTDRACEQLRTQGVSSFLDGKEWYLQQAFRAVNQAAGRVIRHSNDFGCVVLIDERYNESSVRANLSPWLQKALSCQPSGARVSFESVRSDIDAFFASKCNWE